MHPRPEGDTSTAMNTNWDKSKISAGCQKLNDPVYKQLQNSDLHFTGGSTSSGQPTLKSLPTSSVVFYAFLQIIHKKLSNSPAKTNPHSHSRVSVVYYSIRKHCWDTHPSSNPAVFAHIHCPYSCYLLIISFSLYAVITFFCVSTQLREQAGAYDESSTNPP